MGPDQWFRASDHYNWLEAVQYVDGWQGCCDLHCVDVFSASEAIAKAFKRRHYKALSWDIKLSTAMDIVTRSGWYDLLQLCLRLQLARVLFRVIPCHSFEILQSWCFLIFPLFMSTVFEGFLNTPV